HGIAGAPVPPAGFAVPLGHGLGGADRARTRRLQLQTAVREIGQGLARTGPVLVGVADGPAVSGTMATSARVTSTDVVVVPLLAPPRPGVPLAGLAGVVVHSASGHTRFPMSRQGKGSVVVLRYGLPGRDWRSVEIDLGPASNPPAVVGSQPAASNPPFPVSGAGIAGAYSSHVGVGPPTTAPSSSPAPPGPGPSGSAGPRPYRVEAFDNVTGKWDPLAVSHSGSRVMARVAPAAKIGDFLGPSGTLLVRLVSTGSGLVVESSPTVSAQPGGGGA
ncbi:MAG: hypothetical protein ACRD0J_03385, partial [Acidimicrobiales bacterium]